MSGYVETATRTFQAGGAIAQFLRVKLLSEKLAAAGAADLAIGTIEVAALADLEQCAVRLPTAQGTRKMVASASITKHATVYGATGGKISSTANGNPEGVALEAAAGDGSIIEVLPMAVLDTAFGVAGVAAGYKIARGQKTTVAAADTVITGLATVVSVVAVLESDPVDTASVATAAIGDQAGAPDAGSIYIKTWKPTTGGAAGNPTLVAASTFSKKVNWIAIGT